MISVVSQCDREIEIAKFHVQVVFSAPDKLKKLCAKINSNQLHQGECRVHYEQKYVDCRCGIVYEIPFTRGKVCVGQKTGRCVNDRVR